MIELSNKTAVEVQEGQFGPYLALGRKVADSTKYRWVFLSKTAVKAIDPEKIASLLEKKGAGYLQLCGNQHAVVSQYRDLSYIGFHRLDGHGEVIRGKGLNLNRDEWQTLASDLPRLVTQLETTTLTQYLTDGVWVFLPEEVGSAGETRTVPRPSSSTLMSWLYIHLVSRDISKKMAANCDGCKCDAPGQRSHMVFGCLQPWSDAVEFYLEDVQTSLDTGYLKEMFNRVLKALELPPPFSVPAVMDRVLVENPRCVMTNLLKDAMNIVPQEYARVFDQLSTGGLDI
jgi:hypothetical protein